MLGPGLAFLVSPFLLWRIHGGYGRHVRIVDDPHPYGDPSGPFRIAVHSGPSATGFVLTSLELGLRAPMRYPV